MDEKFPEVDPRVVSKVAEMLGNQQVISRQLTEDPAIKTTKQLFDSLRSGQLTGAALVEWRDDKGPLRVNVIDFISSQKLKAVDPNTGESVEVQRKTLPDGCWRILA